MSAVPEEVATSGPGPVDLAASPVMERTAGLGAPTAELNAAGATVAPNDHVAAEAPREAVAPAPAPAPAPKSAAPGENNGMNQSDFENMFKELSEGDVVTGTVVHIDKDGVLVDVGSKSEGIIRPNELSREPFDNIEDVVKVGEHVKVVVIGRDHEDGNLLLSKKRADFEKAWDKVMDALNTGTILHAMVSERVKGGLVVDLGIRGFVPASHVGSGDFKHQNLDKYVGQSIALKVIEVDRERRKVVLSNRDATREERENRKSETLSGLKEGDIRKGIVRRVTDYGAFIDLGGIDGLLHVSEMSWTRIKHPSEVVHNGQELDVKILKLKLDQGRISLGLRDILPDPWTELAGKYRIGETVKVTVSRLVPFGAFVSLEEGVEAIIPNHELSDRRISKPADVVNVGQEVEAKIIEVRPEERKMTLSIRRLIESMPREPFVPEIPGGESTGRPSRDRGEREGREPRDVVRPEGGREVSGGRENRERRRREGRGGGREFGPEAEDDYKEYKNFRASQREETFGTSLADVLGESLGLERAKAESEEEKE